MLKIAGPETEPAEACVSQVVGVDELVAIRPVTEHDGVGPVGDPVEQNAEDAEAPVAEDGARTDDGDIEAGPRGVETCPLGSELGAAVRLGRVGNRVGEHRVVPRDPEHGARRSVHHLFDARVSAGFEQSRRPLYVDTAEHDGILRERHLRDIVEHDVTPGDGFGDDAWVANVTLDELDPVGLFGGDEVEAACRVPVLDESFEEQRAEIAAPTGDEAPHSSNPCSTHQRMLRRIPSYRSTSGT